MKKAVKLGHKQADNGICVSKCLVPISVRDESEAADALKRLHDADVRIFALEEPVVTFDASVACIRASLPYCNHYIHNLL